MASNLHLKKNPYPKPKAKGRTNVELREQFVLADSVRGQSMTPFKSKSPFQSDGSITMTGPISKVFCYFFKKETTKKLYSVLVFCVSFILNFLFLFSI